MKTSGENNANIIQGREERKHEVSSRESNMPSALENLDDCPEKVWGWDMCNSRSLWVNGEVVNRWGEMCLEGELLESNLTHVIILMFPS